MTDEKGLAPDVADKIGEYIKHKGMLKEHSIILRLTPVYRGC
jgi:hypothetical protein